MKARVAVGWALGPGAQADTESSTGVLTDGHCCPQLPGAATSEGCVPAGSQEPYLGKALGHS